MGKGDHRRFNRCQQRVLIERVRDFSGRSDVGDLLWAGAEIFDRLQLFRSDEEDGLGFRIPDAYSRLAPRIDVLQHPAPQPPAFVVKPFSI